MALVEAMMSELEQETRLTRKCLERVPEERLDWKPHEKSFSLRELSSHLADVLQWMGSVMNQESFELTPDFKPYRADSKADLLAVFDKNAQAAREALQGKSDEQLMSPWRFISEGKVTFEMSRLAVARNFLLNHLVHHRGQLTVYLRLLDVPVPAIYGPSADER